MTPSQRLSTDIDRRITRGVVAGTAAGLLFLLANMWFAVSKGMPAAAPLYDISTIFHFADKPQPTPENEIVGLVTHLTLAAGFGVLLALVAPLLRSRAALWGGGIAFGLVLYLVNFQILGRVAFEMVPGRPQPDLRAGRPRRLRARARAVPAQLRTRRAASTRDERRARHRGARLIAPAAVPAHQAARTPARMTTPARVGARPLHDTSGCAGARPRSWRGGPQQA